MFSSISNYISSFFGRSSEEEIDEINKVAKRDKSVVECMSDELDNYNQTHYMMERASATPFLSAFKYDRALKGHCNICLQDDSIILLEDGVNQEVCIECRIKGSNFEWRTDLEKFVPCANCWSYGFKDIEDGEVVDIENDGGCGCSPETECIDGCYIVLHDEETANQIRKYAQSKLWYRTSSFPFH